MTFLVCHVTQDIAECSKKGSFGPCHTITRKNLAYALANIRLRLYMVITSCTFRMGFHHVLQNIHCKPFPLILWCWCHPSKVQLSIIIDFQVAGGQYIYVWQKTVKWKAISTNYPDFWWVWDTDRRSFSETFFGSLFVTKSSATSAFLASFSFHTGNLSYSYSDTQNVPSNIPWTISPLITQTVQTLVPDKIFGKEAQLELFQIQGLRFWCIKYSTLASWFSFTLIWRIVAQKLPASILEHSNPLICVHPISL